MRVFSDNGNNSPLLTADWRWYFFYMNHKNRYERPSIMLIRSQKVDLQLCVNLEKS